MKSICNTLRERGNEFFKQNNFLAAIDHYEMGKCYFAENMFLISSDRNK